MLTKRSNKIRYIAATSLLAVFIIDMITPAAYVIDILYICCIVLVVKQGNKTIIGFSTASIFLICTDVFFFSHHHLLSLSDWTNRGIAIVAILIISYIAILYQEVDKAARLKEQQYLKSLKEMLFITSHKVRKPVANIIGLVENLNDADDDLSAADMLRHCAYLQFSAKELDLIIRELSLFIEQTEQQNKV